MSTSTQSTLLKQVGHYGGERLVGDQTVSGNFMAIHALADTTVMAGTEGSIGNFVGSIIVTGDVIVGEWTTLHISGEAIVYYST
tara:strand:- start:122 stop:373 length:252 start_codon:yes stop_codon:yes gene_type:complete